MPASETKVLAPGYAHYRITCQVCAATIAACACGAASRSEFDSVCSKCLFEFVAAHERTCDYACCSRPAYWEYSRTGSMAERIGYSCKFHLEPLADGTGIIIRKVVKADGPD